MSKGITSVSTFSATLSIILISISIKGGIIPNNLNSPSGMWTTKVTRPMHPEMADVKPGEELMGVTFDQKTSCSLEEYQALQKRIEELKIELLMEEEDEDDDGDIVVRR